MKAKLIEIIRSVPISNTYPEYVEALADKLLENNVIIPPCKVGDKTYLLLEKLKGGYDIVESKCVKISENENGKWQSVHKIRRKLEDDGEL